MRRSREQLRRIHEKLEKIFADKYKGLGTISIIFDTAGPPSRPVGTMLHGVDMASAVRILREQADWIEKAERGSSLIVAPNQPLIIPPTRM